MVNVVPSNWKYSNELENLFLFYQKTEELLNECTCDTYSLPLHNTVSLVYEIREVFGWIKKYNLFEQYYKKYITPIIDEFLIELEEDDVLIEMLGKRFDSVRKGFIDAKENHLSLETWMNVFFQSCSLLKYKQALEKRIIELITQSKKNKKKLLRYTASYYVCLVQKGYSNDYLFMVAKDFFSYRDIVDANQIKDFFKNFDFKVEKYELLVLLNMDSLEYMEKINRGMIPSDRFVMIDVEKERNELVKDTRLKHLIECYDEKNKRQRKHDKTAIIRYTEEGMDPYTISGFLENYLNILQTFSRYFIHFRYTKQIHHILYKKKNGYYKEIKNAGPLRKRPYVDQETIDARVKNIINARSMRNPACMTLFKAVLMHAEALDCRSTTNLVRTFWTALETLFLNPDSKSIGDNVISSVLSIIQKTVILKTLRCVYVQLNEAVKKQLQDLGISDFISFVEYFSSHNEKAEEMTKIYDLLKENPLLRTRLFSLRQKIGDNKGVRSLLDKHKKRVEFHLKRIYRIRNIATHLGEEIDGAKIAVNHLHNYFDYVINYMLCKSENDDEIINISSIVFEAQNDNIIHNEILQENTLLTKDNYRELLFGPDKNLINYKFEF